MTIIQEIQNAKGLKQVHSKSTIGITKSSVHNCLNNHINACLVKINIVTAKID